MRNAPERSILFKNKLIVTKNFSCVLYPFNLLFWSIQFIQNVSKEKSQETHLKCILIPGGNSLHLGRPLVIGSLKTHLNTRWKQGLFNFSWTKKNTSPAVDNALCSHVAQNDCDYCEWLLPIVYIAVLFIYATKPLRFLISFLNTFSAGDTLVSSHKPLTRLSIKHAGINYIRSALIMVVWLRRGVEVEVGCTHQV